VSRRRDGGAADRRGRRADDGDPDLDRGEELLGRLPQRSDRSGAATPLVDQRGEPRLAHRDHRHLRAREEPVREDEQEEDANLGEHGGTLTLRRGRARGELPHSRGIDAPGSARGFDLALVRGVASSQHARRRW